jgi:hypothetical protein
VLPDRFDSQQRTEEQKPSIYVREVSDDKLTELLGSRGIGLSVSYGSSGSIAAYSVVELLNLLSTS